ncbi:hypothetical protein BJY01DRAFT_252850 [Aspergillus pseudoustus]|uniref:FAD-binding domain-containing protein n=1 Tax=Aspergillus pseudoustus TaxID=1810923 RepID=A0ABR4J487_9EURO
MPFAGYLMANHHYHPQLSFDMKLKLYTMGPCRVIIVGGGIGGLTLALMLEKNGIDYVLLEAYEEIVAKASAGICLFANALRILDQLGCYEDPYSHAQDVIKTTSFYGPNGLQPVL